MPTYTPCMLASMGVQVDMTAPFFTSAEEGGYVFSSFCLSVCLSVCLTVRRITRKLVNGF